MTGNTKAYEVEFRQSTVSYKVTFNADGTYLQTEKYFPFNQLRSDLQTALQQGLSNQFKKFRIGKTCEISNGQELRYELVVRGGKGTGEHLVNFDRQGIFIDSREIGLKHIQTHF